VAPVLIQLKEWLRTLRTGIRVRDIVSELIICNINFMSFGIQVIYWPNFVTTLRSHITFSCNFTYGNRSGWDPVTVMTNSADGHGRSISQGIIQILRDVLSEMWGEHRQAGGTSVNVTSTVGSMW